MVEFLNSFFNTMFGPVISLGPLYGISIVSALVSFIFALLNRLMVDISEMKRIKEKLKFFQQEAKKYQKEKNEKKMKELMGSQLEYSNKMMKMNMKPLLVSLLVIFPLLPWLRASFGTVQFVLPFPLPFAFDAAVGWLGLYILVSFPTTFVFRKALGVD